MTNIEFDMADPEDDWQNSTLEPFDFGRVLGRSFSGLLFNLPLLFIVLLISLTATVWINIFANEELLKTLGDGSEVDIALASYEADYWVWTIASFLPAILLALWFQLIVVQTSYAGFTELPFQSSPLITGLRALFPMLVIATIYSFIGIVGFVFAWPGWALAGPILVHEKKGIFESMGAAWKLSDGYKLWVFLLLIVMTLIGAGVYFATEFMLSTFTNMDIFGDGQATAVSLSTSQKVQRGFFVGLPQFFVYGFFAAGMTAAYVEIKSLKGRLALVDDVFD